MFKIRRVFIAISIFVLWFISENFLSHQLKISTKLKRVQKIFQTTDVNNQFKILFWTRFWSLDWLPSSKEVCEHGHCHFSYNRTELESYDAIVFHMSDINIKGLPPVLKHQQWVIYNLESPHLSNTNYDILKLSKIDIIMNYRTDSDIQTSYGKMIACNRKWSPKYTFEDKSKSIAWVVSNCNAPSNRQDYVKLLAKYIDVDIFGNCGSKQCPKGDICNDMLAKNYKFYLSFENSICKDYVTEKVFDYINLDLIPVVLGGANYSSILPYNSYIDVMNFTSVRHLAQYLKSVGNNKSLFNSYFEWKNKYCVKKLNLQDDFCRLCKHLSNNRNEKVVSSVSEFKKWWVNDSNCSKIVIDKENWFIKLF